MATHSTTIVRTNKPKLAFVRYPEKVEPLMRLWYETRPIEPVQASQDELAASLTKFLYPSGMKIIVVTMFRRTLNGWEEGLERLRDGSLWRITRRVWKYRACMHGRDSSICEGIDIRKLVVAA